MITASFIYEKSASALSPATEVAFFDSTSAFSGRCLVISSRVVIVWKRRVGVVGLYVLIGITKSLHAPTPNP